MRSRHEAQSYDVVIEWLLDTDRSGITVLNGLTAKNKEYQGAIRNFDQGEAPAEQEHRNHVISQSHQTKMTTHANNLYD